MGKATPPVFGTGRIRLRIGRLRMPSPEVVVVVVVVVCVVRKARSVVVGFLRPMPVLAKRLMKGDVSQW